MFLRYIRFQITPIMKKHAPHSFLLTLGAGALMAQQPKSYQLLGSNTTGSFSCLINDSVRITAALNQFGVDSTHLELTWNGADMSPLAVHAYSLKSQTSYVNHAIPAGDGILVGGGRSVAFPYTPMAFLAKTDASGNLEWIKNLESDNHQDQIISLVPNGDSFTAFTIRGGVRAPEVDRVDGQVDGSGISITPIVANASFQLARSMRIGTSQRILSVGMGAPQRCQP